jgi:hypothetical protein
MSFANVLTSTANAALNSYISPRYSRGEMQLSRAPGQPAPPAFGIWFPIFAGNIGYGFLSEEDQTPEASFWNHVIAATGFTYAYTLVSSRFYSLGAAMAAMTGASFMYRRSLPVGDSVGSRAVRFAAELGVGWLAAADMVVVAQNTRRALGRSFTSNEQHAIGVGEAAAVTGAALVANRLLGWKGVSVAAAWALGAIALDQRSEKHVRAVAGVAACGVLADLALTVFGNIRAEQVTEAVGTDYESVDEIVVVEDLFIPPSIVVEEITTVRV